MARQDMSPRGYGSSGFSAWVGMRGKIPGNPLVVVADAQKVV